MANITNIIIQAKQWHDKENGNTYFSALVTVFYRNGETLEKIQLPIRFQYGYENHYQEVAFSAIKKRFGIDTADNLNWWCNANNVDLNCEVKPSTESMCREWGESHSVVIPDTFVNP